MSRTDIQIDISSDDDLIFENSNNPFFDESVWGTDESGFPVLSVRLESLRDNVLDFQAGLVIDAFTRIPELDETESPFLIYFFHIDTLGNRTESPKFFAVDEKQRLITPFNVQRIDENGQNLIFDGNVPQSYQGRDGAFIVRTFEEGDFFIDDSIEQNEKILLITNKGNILSDPTKGVEIVRELNGIQDRDSLDKNIRNEWSKDELRILTLNIDTDDGGVISVDSDELFENQ